MITEKKHFYWLDLIRFISALLVVMVHIRCEFFVTYSMLDSIDKNLFSQFFYFINSFGSQAVLIFFILSGFLVGGLNIDKALRRKFYIKDFIIDRSVRILLPLLGSLIIVFIIDLISNEHHTIGELFGNLLGLQGVIVNDVGGVFWTLSYEIWFYVLIGCTIYLFTKRKFNYICVLLLSCSFIIFAKLYTFLLFILIFGILAYFLSKIKIRKEILILCVPLFILFWFLVNFSAKTNVTERYMFTLVSKETTWLLFGVITAILISQIVSIKPRGIFYKIDKLGSKLAVFSYSLYITHYQCCRCMHLIGFPKLETINTTSLFYFFIEVFSCILFAYIFYQLTEKHTSIIQKYLKTIIH